MICFQLRIGLNSDSITRLHGILNLLTMCCCVKKKQCICFCVFSFFFSCVFCLYKQINTHTHTHTIKQQGICETNDKNSSMPYSQTRIYKVAIIGAGIGGSSCAYFLATAKRRRLQQLFDIDIFEKENRVGGRVYGENMDGEYKELGYLCYLCVFLFCFWFVLW